MDAIDSRNAANLETNKKKMIPKKMSKKICRTRLTPNKKH